MIRPFLVAAAIVASAAPPPKEKVTPAFNQRIPNIPGKSVVAAVVDYPPGGSSPPHHHAPSAFIFAYVISGHIRSSVNGTPVRVYGPGESWSEPPGAHHTISVNVSSTQPARLLATFILNTDDRKLVIPDDGELASSRLD